MITDDEEVYILEELLHSVSNVLSEVDSGRSQVMESIEAPTPAYDKVEKLLSEAYGEIEGRLQEVDAEYSERKSHGSRARAQAKKVLSYGVNYQAIKGVPYEETDKVLLYLEEHGLASMSYEATRDALSKYRRWEQNEEERVRRA